jgi:hypothetical protein
LEAETNKYCPGGYETGAISNLITWVLNFFLSAGINKWALQSKIVQRLVSHKIAISSYWQLEKNTILFLENKSKRIAYRHGKLLLSSYAAAAAAPLCYPLTPQSGTNKLHNSMATEQ